MIASYDDYLRMSDLERGAHRAAYGDFIGEQDFSDPRAVSPVPICSRSYNILDDLTMRDKAMTLACQQSQLTGSDLIAEAQRIYDFLRGSNG